MKISPVRTAFTFSWLYVVVADDTHRDSDVHSSSSLRGGNSEKNIAIQESQDEWLRIVDETRSLLPSTPSPNSKSPVSTNAPVSVSSPAPSSCICNCPDPTLAPAASPVENCVCPTPEPTGSIICPPVECPQMSDLPSPEPINCPSPDPIQCPTPDPVQCPTPEPLQCPPLECPTPQPIQCPPVECPTPQPVLSPTIGPVLCPTPEPIECPLCPTPQPSDEVLCPTPEPVACPAPVICPTPAPNGIMMPTVSPGPLTNDNCEAATSVEINGNPIIGTTFNATEETRPQDVVYRFVGNGRKVRISTCFIETTTAHNFLIRNGGCGSASVGESVSDPDCSGNPNAAAFEFDTVDGRVYPIIVYPRGAGVPGQFALQVTDFINPPNDYCEQSIPIAIGSSPVVGTTVNATQQTRPQDVVYQFVGNGRRVRVSTCFSETTTAHNFLIRNGGCGSASLGETSGSVDCPGNPNAADFEFDTVNGRVYPVVVFPRGSGLAGQFALQVTDFINPSNDNCEAAPSVEVNGNPIIGTTFNATEETRPQDVAYRFVGNGRKVRISTCFSETTTAHNFLVRNGGCGSASLGESVSDPDCPGNPNAAAFEFDTVNGRVYPVIVYPRGNRVPGQFAVQVTDFINPPNDYCEQSIPIAIGSSPVVGTTVNATQQTRSEDVVYQFVGNGGLIRISTCFSETTTAHNFLVRNGGCGSASLGETSGSVDCPGIPNAAEFEFESVSGRVYPVIVFPRNIGDSGSFSIQVTAVPST